MALQVDTTRAVLPNRYYRFGVFTPSLSQDEAFSALEARGWQVRSMGVLPSELGKTLPNAWNVLAFWRGTAGVLPAVDGPVSYSPIVPVPIPTPRPAATHPVFSFFSGLALVGLAVWLYRKEEHTRNPIQAFKAYRSGYDRDARPAAHGSLGPGFYFTSSLTRARKYSGPDGCVMQVEIGLHKPLIGPKKDLAEQLGLPYHVDDETGAYDYNVGRKLNDIARREGYDGIVATTASNQEIVVFERNHFTYVGRPDCR